MEDRDFALSKAKKLGMLTQVRQLEAIQERIARTEQTLTKDRTQRGRLVDQMNDPRLLNMTEISNLIGVSKMTVKKWVDRAREERV